MNPELRRNLWLQLSVHRLVAMPAVLGIVLGLTVATTDNARSLALAASWAFALLALVWGARRAAEAVAEEVNGGTWDSQRMSALGAWTMTWGKLIGSTAYPWYGALLSLAVYAAARLHQDAALPVAADVGLAVLSALVGQVVAMAASLVMWRKLTARARIGGARAQGLGIMAGLLAASQSGVLRGSGSDAMDWYGYLIPARPFWLVVLALAFGWALLGVYRLMRQELLYRSYPWAWTGFVLFCMAFAGGFLYDSGRPGLLAVADWRWGYVGVALALVYAGIFGEAKTAIGYGALLAAGRRGSWRRVLTGMPLWLPPYLLAWIAAIVVLLTGPADLRQPLLMGLPTTLLARFGIVTPLAVVAALLFVLRDVALVLALNFGPRRDRADLAAFLYLAMAYGPLAWLAQLTRQPWLMAFLLPLDVGPAAVVLGPVLLEIGLVAIFLWSRWRRYAVPGAAGAARRAGAAASGVAA